MKYSICGTNNPETDSDAISLPSSAYVTLETKPDNPDWQALASQLAINLYILKKESLMAVKNSKNKVQNVSTVEISSDSTAYQQ